MTTPETTALASVSSEDIAALCATLIDQVTTRRIISPEAVREAAPPSGSDAFAWLSFYGQLRAWLTLPVESSSSHEDPDSLVMTAIREAPTPVPGFPALMVYPKSFQTLLQLKVLDAQLDRLTARLLTLSGDDATITEIDGAVSLASAVSYVIGLLAWTWTSEGAGLPFDASDPEPKVPAHIEALTPPELLAITQAAHQFGASLAACQLLVGPSPRSGAGERATWAGFFEAVGAATHMDPRELAVSHSLAKVLSLAFLSSQRQRVRQPGETV